MKRCRFVFDDEDSVDISWDDPNTTTINECYVKAYTKKYCYPPSQDTIDSQTFFLIINEDIWDEVKNKSMYDIITDGDGSLAAFEKENIENN